jgi:hypothetical protein
VSTKAAVSAICSLFAIAAAPLASSASTAAGSWTATADMAIPRDNLTATPLENGRVLVVGGTSESTSELYDPPTGTWIPGGTLSQPRWLHEAVRLRDGRVLVAGGGTYTASAELYYPATNRWTPTGSMSVDRFDFTATLLGDGRVLDVGGFSGNGTGVQASAELYDPVTGRWASTGSLRTPRLGHMATLLPDGTVLVAGGFNSEGFLRSTELYDPARGRWKRVAPMTIARGYGSATLLGNGRVLVAWRRQLQRNHHLRRAVRPGLRQVDSDPRMTDYHGPEAVLLQDGRVLLAGGGYAGDVYSPATGTWNATGPRFHGLVGGAALALLPNGQVLSAGGARLANCTPKGCGSEPVASAELYTP